jgi:hypothetical protein
LSWDVDDEDLEDIIDFESTDPAGEEESALLAAAAPVNALCFISLLIWGSDLHRDAAYLIKFVLFSNNM